MGRKRRVRWLLAVAALVVGCAGAGAPIAPRSTADAGAAAWRYALVIEGSSSASTLFIYQWRPGREDHLPRIHAAPFPAGSGDAVWEMRVRPGLSHYAGRPQEAARSLAPLLDYALQKIGDPAARGRSSVHVWATAGMRLLSASEQEEILQAVADYLATTPFAAAPPRVISGSEEGIYGWLAVNYLLGHLEHGGPFPTVGALDLGGASTQITFVPLDHPRQHGQVVRLGAKTFHLYTYSYLGLGQDVARETVATPACFLRGYRLADGRLGTGDYAACREAIRATLFEPCREPPCSGFGIYQPPVYGDFLAFSVYAYTADFFGLGSRLLPAELEAAAEAFCARAWDELVAEDPEAGESLFVPRYCFSASYIVALLTEGFGFPRTSERIQAPRRVQGVETGWTLGALLYELAGDAD